MGELVSSDYSPFNFGVDTGDARENAGLDKPIAGADGLQQRFDSLWGDARDKYRSEVDMASSGYQNTKENGRQIIQDNHNNNTAVVQDSAETHSALVKAAPDQGLEAPKTKLKSATPVTDTGKNLLEINGNNTLVVGAKQVVSGVADAYSTGKESVGEGIERLKEWDREYRARHKLEREQQAGGENQE
ncbi:hypothetical protein [Azotobacter beijerinckii]|uniref:Uncharacterized protein n=1 Tax=Azotobacter beijerinckii TaxID=170623 RepID=A0A1I4JIW4_9GAMM|nr:hypothetical protein [Azotobacter beijerinckii]SFL66515.1 hypothetical protein SAMN04244574_04841 [Azotobacter beijerinckii]